MATDRATLEAWIADTRRHQRRLRRALLPASIVALGLLVWSRPIGGAAVLLVVLTAVLGSWIMSSHVLDWQTKIAALDRPPVVGRAVKRRPNI